MDQRRGLSVTSAAFPRSDANRRLSCTFVDDACVYNSKQHGHGRRLSTPITGDHSSSGCGGENLHPASALTATDRQMGISASYKMSHSCQCVRTWCSSGSVWGSRRSCSVVDAGRDPETDCYRERRRLATVTPTAVCIEHQGYIAATAAGARHFMRSSSLKVSSAAGLFVKIQGRASSVEHCHVRDNKVPCGCSSNANLASNARASPQLPCVHQFGNIRIYEWPHSPEHAAYPEGITKQHHASQEAVAQGTRHVLLPEGPQSPVEIKYGAAMLKSSSCSNTMGSWFTFNTERVGNTSGCDAEQSSSSCSAGNSNDESYKVLQAETARIHCCDGRTTIGTEGRVIVPASYSPRGEPSPSITNPGWVLVSPCTQKERGSRHILQLTSPSANQVFIYPEQPHQSVHQEHVGINESHSSVQQQFDRNQQNAWKQPLSSVTELSDDGNDADTPPTRRKSAKLDMVKVDMAKVRESATSGESQICCPCKDPAQAESLQQVERNVYIFLNPLRLKIKRKVDIDTVLISFCVSPACITFSVLQMNYSSERIGGGVIFAKVLILDSRLAHCKEACYRQNCFVVNLGQEVHFCFPDPMCLEYMSLNIEMLQQQKRKNKCFGCVDIKLSEQNQLTDIILWKTLNKKEKLRLWRQVCCCFARSSRQEEYLKRLSTEHL